MDTGLLNKPVKKALVSMAAPAAFGMLMTFLFQLVDTFFIGQLGTKELAAISFSYPIYIFIVSFFMGTAAGVSSVVGKALGEGDSTKAQSLTTLSILVFMLFSVLLAVAGIFTIQPTFSLLGATAETIAMISSYMLPLYIGMFALVGTLIGNAALMSKGIMIQTTVIMAIGGIINVIFDYLLIFGVGLFPALGLQGAAVATLISWVSIFGLMLLVLIKEDLFALSSLHSFSQAKVYFKEIMLIASPAIAAQVLNPIAIAVITRMVSQYGDNAIAAYGIVTRIESLILTGILALSVIVTPLVAQNYGAKAYKRLDQVIAYSGRMTVYWGLFFFAIMVLFSQPIIGIFTDSKEIIEYGQLYFNLVGLSFPAFGLALITTSFFNGVQQASLSLRLTLVKAIIFTLPLAVVGAWMGLTFIWIGIAFANVLAAVYAKRLLNGWLEANHSELLMASPLLDYFNDIRSLWSRCRFSQKSQAK